MFQQLEGKVNITTGTGSDSVEQLILLPQVGECTQGASEEEAE